GPGGAAAASTAGAVLPTNRSLDLTGALRHHPDAMDVGIGLWTMRSTAACPASHPRLYGELAGDARLAESLGFHSLWLAEHHFWYDGWCPTPLVAAGAVLAATERLHVGTGIHLMPLYDPDRAAAEVDWLHRLSDGRFEHGVGLGFRAAEYD